MSDYEVRDLIIAFMALIANFGALFFLGFEVRRVRQETKKESLRRSREATLNHYATTLAERNELRLSLPNAPSAEVLNSVEQRRPVTRYLAYWELLAAGVNLGIYDFDTVQLVAGARIRKLWTNWKFFVDDRRATTGNPRMYCVLETLVHRLSNSEPVTPT